MKLTTRFLTLLAFAAAVFTGCRQEERDYDLPSIKVGGSDLHFDAETKKASCAVGVDLTTYSMTIQANRDWTASIKWDSDEIPWIAVTPEQGTASDIPQLVTVTVLNNPGFNRSKQVKFSINYDYKTIDFSQKGERGEEIIGTKDNPLTVAGAIKYVKSLGGDTPSASKVFVKGKISQIDDGSNFAASGTYGNATFYISDDGSESSEQFYCFRVLYLGNKKWSSKTDTDIKVGDDVVICGQIVNYKGNTPETVQGTAFVYEHNGENRGEGESGGGGESTEDPSGTGTVADPYNVAAALAVVKPLTWTSNDTYESTDEVYVKGKISRIADNGTFGQSGTFGNATFYISDDGSQNGELYCYRILYLGNKKYTSGDDIKVGDDVVVCGKLMNYRGNTPETVSNSAYLYSLNSNGGGGGGGETGGEAKGTGTQADPYNPLGAAKAVAGLTWTSNTDYQKTGVVYVKGKISRIADKGTFTEGGTYGNASFYISEDGAQKDEFYCFRILYLGNVKYTSGDDIKVGDDVVVCGALMNYRGNTPETVAGEAYLFSLNDSGNGGGGSSTDEVKAVTVAEFLAAPESDKQVYELVGTIGGSINTTYGNFDLTDESGTVYVYGLTATNNGYGTQNDKSFASLGLKEGDKIKVRGYRGSFTNQNTGVKKDELVYAWFIEKVPGGGGGSTAGDGTLDKPYSPAEAIAAVKGLTWTSNTVYDKTEKVYVKGKISKISNNGTYGQSGTYGNANYFISADGTESGDQFQIFRSLYFNGEKYTAGPDIAVGDEVIVYGALMNYKGNTPETVANENWLYSLNGKTSADGDTGGGSGGGDTTPKTLTITTNSSANFAADSHATYGGGFAATCEGVKVAFYKHTSTNNPVTPSTEMRVYKNSVLCLTAPSGKTFKKVVLTCPNTENGKYCVETKGLEGCGDPAIDKTALTVTWNGSTGSLVLQATGGQLRVTSLDIEFE